METVKLSLLEKRLNGVCILKWNFKANSFTSVPYANVLGIFHNCSSTEAFVLLVKFNT